MLFGGEANLDFHHFSQTIVAAPGVYRFQARVKTARLTTDKGVMIRIYDPEPPARLDTATEPPLGTAHRGRAGAPRATMRHNTLPSCRSRYSI